MKSVFFEWYPPSPEERRQLWEKAVFVLDTNVLLDIYRYPDDAKDQFLAVLQSIKDRLWMPQQVGLEYLRHREGIVPALQTVLATLRERVEKAVATVEGLPVPEYHPVLDRAALETAASAALVSLQALMAVVDDSTEKTARMVEASDPDTDPIWQTLTGVYKGRTGAGWAEAEWKEFFVEARQRFGAQIPPGYLDAPKGEPDCFGDLVIWRQLVHAAQARPDTHRTTVFVTNDRKEDWWERRRGELRGPRRELIREYREATGGQLLMHTSAEFLEAAREFLRANVTVAAIAEVERVSAEPSVTKLLWHKRMTLPPASVRDQALRRVFEGVQGGTVKKADDLNQYTNEAASASPVSSYVATPLFFSLINRTYGPLVTVETPGQALRNWPIHIKDGCGSADAFLEQAHAAWVAQALFRVWHQDVSDDAVLTEFFDSSDDWARATVRRARAFVMLEHDEARRSPANTLASSGGV